MRVDQACVPDPWCHDFRAKTSPKEHTLYAFRANLCSVHSAHCQEQNKRISVAFIPRSQTFEYCACSSISKRTYHYWLFFPPRPSLIHFFHARYATECIRRLCRFSMRNAILCSTSGVFSKVVMLLESEMQGIDDIWAGMRNTWSFSFWGC